MRGRHSARRGGVGLNAGSGATPTLPAAVRGAVVYGDEAARRASSVSGPFTAAPLAFVLPRDEEDLLTLVRWAWEERVPLVPRAGGTGMPGGNLGPYVVVELSDAFAGTRWLDAETVRVGAGTLGAALAAEAGERRRFLPFLPSSAAWCRFGGMIANNAAGARSFKYGAIANRVEAVEGCFSWGEPFRVGGDIEPPAVFRELYESLLARWPQTRSGTAPAGWPHVRKNSSGYALDRYLPTGDPAQLLVGSEGTLAFITAVELRLPPIPPALGLAVASVSSSRELTAVAVAARDIGASTCDFLGRRLIEMADLASDPQLGDIAADAYALVLIELEGSEEEMDRELDALSKWLPGAAVTSRDPETIRRLWDVRHAASPLIAREADRGRISTQFIEDCVVPPEALGRYLDGLDEILRRVDLDAVVFGHAGDGNVHVNPLVDVTFRDWRIRVRKALEEVTDLVAALGGTLAGEHGDGRLRAPLLQRIWPPSIVRSFQFAKDALDPRGILNPGVVLPLPGQDPLEGLTPRPRGDRG